MKLNRSSQDRTTNDVIQKIIQGGQSVTPERLAQIDIWLREFRMELESRRSEIFNLRQQLKNDEKELSEALVMLKSSFSSTDSLNNQQAAALSEQIDETRKKMLSHEQELEKLEEWFQRLCYAKSHCDELHHECTRLLNTNDSLDEENRRLSQQIKVKDNEISEMNNAINGMSDQMALRKSRRALFLKSYISFFTAWFFYILGLGTCGWILLDIREDSSQQNKLPERLVSLIIALSSCGFGVSISRMAKNYDQQLQEFRIEVERLSLIDKMSREDLPLQALEASQKLFDKLLVDNKVDERSFIGKILDGFKGNDNSDTGDDPSL
jgi:hypothetical protein